MVSSVTQKSHLAETPSADFATGGSSATGHAHAALATIAADTGAQTPL